MNIINRRSIILIIGLILSILAFVYTDARFTAYLIILFAIVFIGALLCVLFTGRHISVELSGQPQGTKGNPASVKISISNRSIIPVIMCNADVLVRNLLTGESDTGKYCFCIKGNKTKELDINIKSGYCGCIRVEPGKLSVSDPFRVFERIIRAGSGDLRFSSTYYLPEAVETMVSPEDVSAYDMESYKYSSASKGNDPAETFDVKSYERGDNFKAIHWKLSSKMDDLVIREYGLPIENNVLVIADKNGENISPKDADARTEFAASISYTLLKKEVNHTIGWYDANTGTFESERVFSNDSFWIAMKGLVSSPFAKDDMSSIDRFIESDTEKDYSAYVLVSSEGTDMEKLMAYGQVNLYRPEDFK